MAKKKKEILFCDYYDEWVETYKVGAIANVTLTKYYQVAKHLRKICPKLLLSDFDRREYQKIINEYAKTHEKQTTVDFHHHVKSCIKDAFHDGLLDRDPTYKAVLKGAEASINKKKKFLQVDELKVLLSSLDLEGGNNHDWLILFMAKTGIRFAEALGITPDDFDWENNQLSINKTWNYKTAEGGFRPTKTRGSVRKIKLDQKIVEKFKPLISDWPGNEPLFVGKLKNGQYKRIFNSTINDLLEAKCTKLGITVISCHGLRHTLASVLLAEGVSIHSISNILGHADVGVTQETYAHVLDELQRKDDEKMMSVLMQIA